MVIDLSGVIDPLILTSGRPASLIHPRFTRWAWSTQATPTGVWAQTNVDPQHKHTLTSRRGHAHVFAEGVPSSSRQRLYPMRWAGLTSARAGLWLPCVNGRSQVGRFNQVGVASQVEL